MRDRILEFVDKLPSLPASTAKVIEVCNDYNASASDLQRVIGSDPVLVAKLLKLVNSAYHGLPNPVPSVARAIVMLGVNTVKNLVLSTAAFAGVGQIRRAKGFNLDAFWEHCLAVGVATRLVAEHRETDKRRLDEFFVSGLVHDLGKLPIAHVVGEDYRRLISQATDSGRSLFNLERDVLGTSHGEIGAAMCRKWGLPPAIEATLRFHDEPQQYRGPDDELVLTVAYANWGVIGAGIGFAGNSAFELADAVGTRLAIDPALFSTLEPRVTAGLSGARAFLEAARG